MSVTIRDVSQRCGLSISTVSKVFNGYSDISAETREQVMRVAHEIGYHPNALARALKTNRSYNLGVLFVDENTGGLTHPFYSAVLNAFKSESEAHGYDITFINHNIGTSDMSYLEHCRYRNVDGVCLACVDFYSAEVAELVNSDIPCTTIDHMFNNRPCVISENVNGITQLVDRAVQLGHRRIAYVHGQRNSAVTENRISGFYRAMDRHGLPVPEGFVTESRYYDLALTGQIVKRLLQRPDHPTCLLLPDDSTALGAIQTITGLGLRVPEDISIAGYDGIPLSQMLRPTLTTIRQDSVSMGREAAIRLIDRIERPNTSISDPTFIKVEFLKGETFASVPAQQ